jgi:hypothetical protein
MEGFKSMILPKKKIKSAKIKGKNETNFTFFMFRYKVFGSFSHMYHLIDVFDAINKNNYSMDSKIVECSTSRGP